MTVLEAIAIPADEARGSPKVVGAIPDGIPDDRAMLRAAVELTRDLAAARAAIYWSDMLGSALLGYAGLAGAILLENPWAALASGLVSALALYRAEDYRKAGLPMLPITHGPEFTRLQVFLYTIVLFAATLLPFVYGMSGWIYLASAVALGVAFMAYAWQLWRTYSDALARRTFRFSIWHLSLLFAALLLDHYLNPWLSRAVS